MTTRTPIRVMGHLVDAFSTGFLHGLAFRTGGRYRWVRYPGRFRADPFTPVPPQVRQAVDALPTLPVQPVVAVARCDSREYLVAGAASVGALLATPPRAEDWVRLVALLKGVGELLRALHRAVPPATGAGPPAGMRRLSAWLRTGGGPGAAARLHDAALRRLGSTRMERLRDWCAEVTAAEGGFLCGATTGSLVPGDALGVGQLLMGEELGRGPAECDLGWLVGEFTEFRLLHFTPPKYQIHACGCAAAVRGLLRGYGERLDRDVMARVAVLRVLTHAHDFAAYVGWTDQLTSYLDLVAGLEAGDLATIVAEEPEYA